jgi:DNA-binding winged helix-turn-helix (wHTH) protein/tetratricopeptide (TPR) repeat protein
MKTGNLFRFGEYEVDAQARTARRHGAPLALSRRAFDVLLYFVQNAGRAISKDELLRSVWADATVDENSLAQSVSILRKALDERRGESGHIVTLPGRGYQFVSAVEAVAEEDTGLAPAGVTAMAVPPSGMAAASNGGTELVYQKRTVRTSVITEEREALDPPQRPNLFRIALALGLVLAAASVAAWLSWLHFRPVPPPIVVVLADFENSTGDAEFDRFLNRALQIDLEQSPFLNLLSRSKIQETLAEMRRKRDEPLTAALAREVCERNNGQAMLHATLSKLGGSYLLLLDAEGCVSGERLGGYKAQVRSKERLLSELDKATGRVRQQLGESSATRERFRTPIAQATTSSLDALEAYSKGLDCLERGDFKTAEELLKSAIALDPNFATAYRALATSYYNRYELAQAAGYYKKAFDLRGATTERERLSIEALYYGGAIRDYDEAARTFRLLNRIYPNDAGKWGNLCNVYTQMGEYALAIEAGRQALRLDPRSAYVAEVLARAYKRANAFAEAKQVAGAAVAAGTDRFGIHSILFQIAYAERNDARIKSEGEWGFSHQNIAGALDDLALAAATGGRLREALDDLSRAHTESLRNGDEYDADDVLLDAAKVLIDLDEPGQAAARLGQMKDESRHADIAALVRAEAGDPAPAQRLLATADPVTERDTIHVYCTLPMVRAALALLAHRPAEAVRAIEPARPYQLRDFEVPYLRAQAETGAGMLDAAARDYRLILDNQGVDPISPLYSLAQLRLARVLVLQKKPAQAREEYNALFAAWKNADADLPLLVQARREYAALGR